MKKINKKKHWLVSSIILFSIGFCILLFSVITMPMPLPDLPIAEINFYDIEDSGITISYKNIRVADIDPDALDQQQTTCDVAYRMCDDIIFLQNVNDQRQPLNGVIVALGRHGSPTNKLYIDILGGNGDEIIGELSASQLPNPDTLYWLSLDLSSNSIDSTQISIFVYSAEPNSDAKYWMWGASSTNTYPLKSQYHNGDSWVDLPGDFCFKTYTTSTGGGGGGAPSITISMPTWQISILSSAGFLIAALASGIKYKMIFI
jgi:hypothetical protein